MPRICPALEEERSAHMTHDFCGNPNDLHSSKRRRLQVSRQTSANIKRLAEDPYTTASQDTHLSGHGRKKRHSLRSARYSTDPTVSQGQPFQDSDCLDWRDAEARLAYITPPNSDDESIIGTWQEEPREDSDTILEFPLCPRFLHGPAVPGTSTTDAQDGAIQKKAANTEGISRRDTFSPDRFVSSEVKDPLLSETFRIRRNTKELTRSEKLLRHHSASPDPFGPRVNPRVREQSLSSPDSTQGYFRGDRPQPRVLAVNNATIIAQDAPLPQSRQVSAGAVWNIGGSARNAPNGPVRAVSDGRGAFISSGSNAPMYTAEFLKKPNSDDETVNLGDRIAVALDIDRVSRLVAVTKVSRKRRTASTGSIDFKSRTSRVDELKTQWVNGQWIKPAHTILDAPLLRDDFYCTVLAYSQTARTLAVGLANRVYLWSEEFGVRYPPHESDGRPAAYVTSLSFSSNEGRHCILAIGRNTGQLYLWSLHDEGDTRFKARHPAPVSCVSFKPVLTKRPSERFGCMTTTEELLVGDESGQIYYYSIEWMTRVQVDIHGWIGSMKLLAKIDMHSQQICGLAWSPTGEFFASGANDNACCLFEVAEILKNSSADQEASDSLQGTIRSHMGTTPSSLTPQFSRSEGILFLGDLTFSTNVASTDAVKDVTVLGKARIKPGQSGSLIIGAGRQKHKWIHSAAVKAIAFCPWQRGLIATGGGSNDRAIHFYHTLSGACLATINVFAQVTSLVWSTTRREIAATFGYAQPEHPYRIAVFSWPDCRQIVAVPWGNEMRALFAISYPRGPGEIKSRMTLGETWYSRTAEEGCLVVACSDESVKFHEIWSGASKSTQSHTGFLGGSSILESLEGIESEGGEVIR